MHQQKQRRSSALFVISLVAGIVFSACCFPVIAVEEKSPTDILAEIGDTKLTRAEFEKELETFMTFSNPEAVEHFSTAEGRATFLNQVSEIYALQLKAKKDGVDKTEEYKEAFHEMAVSRLSQETMQQLVEEIKITDQQAQKHYDENKSNYVEPAQYKLSQIVVEGLEKAKEIKKQVDAGKSFMELAKKESMDEYAEAGGDRGFVPENFIELQIMEALKTIGENKVSEPIELGDDVYAVVRYSEKKAAATRSFEDVAAQIKKEIKNVKQRELYENEVEKMEKELSFKLNDAAVESLRKESLTAEEQAATLFSYAGKEVKVAKFEAELEQIPAFIRPQLFAGEGLNDFIKQFYARFLAIEQAEKNFAQLAAKFPETMKDVARRTVIKFLLDEKLRSVTITEKEIQDFYLKNMMQFQLPPQFDAHHILVKDEAEAKDILAQLQDNPDDFSKFAEEKSTCPSGKQAGGHLGIFGQGQMVAEFDQACQTAELNKVIGPVQTQFGYHLIRVNNRQTAGTRKLEEVADQIHENLLREKQGQTFSKFVEDIKKEFNVKVYQDRM